MKKQYIKFIEGNQESLDKACKLAEKYGYQQWENKNALISRWEWHLLCTDTAIYYTTIWDDKVLENGGYTELKEEIDWVYVSSASEVIALRSKDKRIRITTLSWQTINKYICVSQWDEGKYLRWDKYKVTIWTYAVPVHTEEKKERKLMMTDSEWEKFQKENNI